MKRWKLNREKVAAAIKWTEAMRKRVAEVGTEEAFGYGEIPSARDLSEGAIRHSEDLAWRDRYTEWWLFHRRAVELVSDERMTKLYALQAHLRGRLHMKKQRLTWLQMCKDRSFTRDQNTALALAKKGEGPGDAFVTHTLETQRNLIGDLWLEFAEPLAE